MKPLSAERSASGCPNGGVSARRDDVSGHVPGSPEAITPSESRSADKMKVNGHDMAKVGRCLFSSVILLTCISCGGKKVPEVQAAAKSRSAADAIFEEGLRGEAVIIDKKLSIRIKSERKTWCLVDADPSRWKLF